MQTVDLTTMSLVELKALAYDTIAEKERLQNQLATINQAIAEKYQQEQKSKEEPEGST